MPKTSKTDLGTKKLFSLDISTVEPDPEQPRKYFDPNALEELKNSIKTHGVLQPILVREGEDGKHIIIAGERRHRASKEVGLSEIPAILTAGKPHELSLIENLLREDLTAIEEAEAIQAMVDKYDYKQEDLARVLGKAESTISEILALNKLPSEIKDDARQNPKCSRRVLLEIVRSKKRRNGMLTLYEKFKDQGLTSEEIKKQSRGPRGSREVKAKEIFYQITGLRNRISSLKTDEWEEEERNNLLEEMQDLKRVIDEKIGTSAG